MRRHANVTHYYLPSEYTLLRWGIVKNHAIGSRGLDRDAMTEVQLNITMRRKKEDKRRTTLTRYKNIEVRDGRTVPQSKEFLVRKKIYVVSAIDGLWDAVDFMCNYCVDSN